MLEPNLEPNKGDKTIKGKKERKDFFRKIYSRLLLPSFKIKAILLQSHFQLGFLRDNLQRDLNEIKKSPFWPNLEFAERAANGRR